MVKKEFLRFALLMSDNNSRDFNYVVSKLIQVTLFKKNDILTINEIIENVESNYGILLASSEVLSSIKDNNEVFIESKKNGKKAFCISENSKNKIKLTVYDKTFEKIIYHFIKEQATELSKIEIPDDSNREKYIFDCIVSFFYFQFNNNAQNLLKILDNDYKWIDNNDEELDFLTRRIALLFLEWNNPEKDVFVYNVINSSYEYCLISLKGNNVPFKNMFKSKKFVLDTNVILSLIGVNGKARKCAAIKFLDKCKEFGIKLIYTNYTKQESHETIRRLTALFNSGFADLEEKEEKNMYGLQELYNEWLLSPHYGKQHNSDFDAYVIKLLDSLLLELEIEEIDSNFISSNNVSINVNIDSLRNKKERLSNKQRPVAVFNHDVINYLYVLSKRPKNCVNVIDCKMLFISFDRILCSWCDEQNVGLPSPVVDADIVYSLLLHFSERTSDDFRSFNEFVGTSIVFLYDKKSALESKSMIAKALNSDLDFSSDTKKKIYLKASEIIDKKVYIDETIDPQVVLKIAADDVHQEDNKLVVEELTKKHDEEIKTTKIEMLGIGEKEGEEKTIRKIATVKTSKKIFIIKFFYGFLFISTILGGVALVAYSSVAIVNGGNRTLNIALVVLAVVAILFSPAITLIKLFFKNVIKKDINLFKIDETRIYNKQYKKIKKQISKVKSD